MIQSMTGYAERSFESPTLQAKVSLKSLNHRFFDWSYKGLPLGHLESRLRGLCQQKIRRGKVEVSIEMNFSDAGSWDLSINEALLQKILSALTRAGRRNKDVQFSVENILRIPQVVELRRKDLSRADTSFILRAFETALDDLVRERVREGRDIVRQLRVHVRTMKSGLDRLTKLLRRQPAFFQEKLKQKYKELNNGTAQSEGRLVEEAAYQAQRYDITE